MEWTVGQEVAMRGLGWGSDVEIGKVKRVTKRFVELEDGSRWTHGGSTYPHQSYSRRGIDPIDDEHRAKVKRQRLLRYLEKRLCDRKHEFGHGIDIDTLCRMAALLKKPEGS